MYGNIAGFQSKVVVFEDIKDRISRDNSTEIAEKVNVRGESGSVSYTHLTLPTKRIV